ncbi:MAG: hypothetical protein ACREIU_02555 [Planctomycetota bacterium]
MSGDSTSIVRGGNGVGGGFGCITVSGAGPGIQTVGSALVEVHSVAVQGGCTAGGFCPCNPAPATSGSGVVLGLPPLPVLEVGGNLVLNGNATFSFANGPALEPFILAAAGTPAYLSPGSLFLGEILVDPADWFPLFTGVLSGAGDFTVDLPLTGIAPGFLYFPVYLQGIALDPGGTSWRVSNSTVATIRP